MSFNLSLLSNAPTVFVPNNENEAKINEDTLNAALLSTVPTVMVPRMLNLGAKSNSEVSNKISLKEKIIQKEKDRLEIRKIARLFAQGIKDEKCILSRLPMEIAILIVSLVGKTLSNKESCDIAVINFDKPIKKIS